MHSADEDGISPGHLLLARRTDVLVDDPHLPCRRQIGGNDQNSLRRHKGANPAHQRIGVLERAKGWSISRKDAENAPAMAHLNLASHDLGAPEYSGTMVRDRVLYRLEVVSRVELGAITAPGGLLDHSVRIAQLFGGH